jgi:hypothetical protein
VSGFSARLLTGSFATPRKTSCHINKAGGFYLAV